MVINAKIGVIGGEITKINAQVQEGAFIGTEVSVGRAPPSAPSTTL